MKSVGYLTGAGGAVDETSTKASIVDSDVEHFFVSFDAHGLREDGQLGFFQNVASVATYQAKNNKFIVRVSNSSSWASFRHVDDKRVTPSFPLIFGGHHVTCGHLKGYDIVPK
jgi:hypothetical protein